MSGVIRSEVVATIALIAVAIGVSGCKSSGSSAAAKTTTASSATAGTQSFAGTASSSASSSGAGAAASPVAAGSGAVADPCVLVTAADVSAALGTTVPPSTSGFTGIFQACAYATPEGSAGDSEIVNVTDRLIDKAGFEASVKQSTGASLLPSVCQDAYASGSNVLAWKNGTEVDTRILGTPAGHDAIEEATKLVTGACAKL